jgi:hypothetical protein
MTGNQEQDQGAAPIPPEQRLFVLECCHPLEDGGPSQTVQYELMQRVSGTDGLVMLREFTGPLQPIPAARAYGLAVLERHGIAPETVDARRIEVYCPEPDAPHTAPSD